MPTDPMSFPAVITVTLNNQPYRWTCTFPDGELYVAVVELEPQNHSCDAVASLLAWPPTRTAKGVAKALWTVEFFWPINGLDPDHGIAAITAAGLRPPIASRQLPSLMRQTEQVIETILQAGNPSTAQLPKPSLDGLRRAITNQFRAAA